MQLLQQANSNWFSKIAVTFELTMQFLNPFGFEMSYIETPSLLPDSWVWNILPTYLDPTLGQQHPPLNTLQLNNLWAFRPKCTTASDGGSVQSSGSDPCLIFHSEDTLLPSFPPSGSRLLGLTCLIFNTTSSILPSFHIAGSGFYHSSFSEYHILNSALKVRVHMFV